jgi:hypothetical protein
MKTSKSRTCWKTTVRKPRKTPLTREALARRLKAAVVVVACVLGIALGIGSAAMSQALFASAQPAGPGRSVSLGELQGIIEVQAEAALSPRAPVATDTAH